MVNVALRAAEKLAEEGIDVEVVDLRCLRPWDKETVFESVKQTGRALVLEEAWQTGAFGGEIASAVQREVFDYLDGPVARLGGVDVPTPYSMSLEPLVAPTEDSVIKTVREELGS
jgi:pyruvate dehydrogenase E1 component beta subunit